MRILWVKTGPLLPLDTGGKRRTHAMLTEISKEHQVTYLSLLPEGTKLEAGEEADPYAAQKVWITAKIVPKHSPRFWLDLAESTVLSSRPYALQKYEVTELRERLQEIAASDLYDLVICDFLAPALNFQGLQFKCPTILFQHNIEAQIWERMALSQKSAVKRWYLGLQFRRMQDWEGKLSKLFTGVITVSPEDTEMARAGYGLKNVLGHVPTGVDVDAFTPPPIPEIQRPFTMGFLGSMDWMPNIDATLFFVRDILPQVRLKHPDCRFKVIGRNPPAKLRELAAQDPLIEVTGTVEEVQPHVHECHAIVVPLQAGGGTRIKIYEAMAMAVPVVSTTIGAEGLAVTNGVDILLADQPDEFAKALSRLAEDPALRQQIAEKARQNVTDHHSWSAATGIFLDLCDDCLTSHPLSPTAHV